MNKGDTLFGGGNPSEDTYEEDRMDVKELLVIAAQLRELEGKHVHVAAHAEHGYAVVDSVLQYRANKDYSPRMSWFVATTKGTSGNWGYLSFSALDVRKIDGRHIELDWRRK